LTRGRRPRSNPCCVQCDTTAADAPTSASLAFLGCLPVSKPLQGIGAAHQRTRMLQPSPDLRRLGRFEGRRTLLQPSRTSNRVYARRQRDASLVRRSRDHRTNSWRA
jgi:hypothetical protein